MADQPPIMLAENKSELRIQVSDHQHTIAGVIAAHSKTSKDQLLEVTRLQQIESRTSICATE